MSNPELDTQPIEIIMSPEDIERVRALLGAQGLYDASQDTYINPDHVDSVWLGYD